MPNTPHVQQSQFPRINFGFLALAALTGCGGDPASKPEGNVVVRDVNNYTATGTLSFDTIETAATGDLDICWTNVTDDIQCHPVSPMADIDNMAMLRLRLTEAQVEERLSKSMLPMSEVDGYLDYKPDHTSTCAKLSQLTLFDTPVSIADHYFESADRTFLLVFTKGTKPGIGARTMTFVKPTSTSTNTRVDAPKGCGLLAFTANISSATPVAVPAAGPWVADWSGITRDGQGNAVIFAKIDGASLGFYEGMDVAQIEADIFDLELNATKLWDIKLMGGRSVDLATAKERTTGTAFAGFTTSASGVWLLALTCSTCQNPAPVVLAVLNPTGA
jgi:hypothetical protein